MTIEHEPWPIGPTHQYEAEAAKVACTSRNVATTIAVKLDAEGQGCSRIIPALAALPNPSPLLLRYTLTATNLMTKLL